MSEKKICGSCKVDIANSAGAVHFLCPSCGKTEIVRCKHCREIAAKYKCAECGFIGYHLLRNKCNTYCMKKRLFIHHPSSYPVCVRKIQVTCLHRLPIVCLKCLHQYCRNHCLAHIGTYSCNKKFTHQPEKNYTKVLNN